MPAQQLTGYATNACFWKADALDQFWRSSTNFPLTGMNVYALGQYDKRPASWQLVYDVLRNRYGGVAALQNYGLYSARELTQISEGVPIGITPNRINSIMGISGNGSQGMIFVEFKLPTGVDAHAFNVRNVGGVVEYWDAGIDAYQPIDPGKWFNQYLVHAWFFPTR